MWNGYQGKEGRKGTVEGDVEEDSSSYSLDNDR